MKAQFRGSRLPYLAALAPLVVSLAGCGGNDNPTFNVPNSLVVTDLNGDGVPDIAVATTKDDGSSGPNPGVARVFLQNTSSPGTFQKATQFSTDNNPSSIASGDLTGTGTADLVVANFVAGNVSVLLETSRGSGQYQNAMNVSTGGTPNDVTLADLNGDGKVDIIAADDANAGRIVILLQDPSNTGHFQPAVAMSTTNGASGVAVGDLNGDGKPDIVAATSDANGNNGTLLVFFQDPNNAGTFLSPVSVADGARPQSVKIVDLDGDGLPDLAAANFGAGSDGVGSAGVSVSIQDATNPGTFLPAVSYGAQSGTVHLAIGDINADGKPDIVTANLGPTPTGSVSVLLQDPTRPGVFQVAQSYGGFGQPLAVALADLNNDGRPDIAVADGDTATVMLQTTTPGAFSSGTQIAN